MGIFRSGATTDSIGMEMNLNLSSGVSLEPTDGYTYTNQISYYSRRLSIINGMVFMLILMVSQVSQTNSSSNVQLNGIISTGRNHHEKLFKEMA